MGNKYRVENSGGTHLKNSKKQQQKTAAYNSLPWENIFKNEDEIQSFRHT